jgi:hypothetical protein
MESALAAIEAQAEAGLKTSNALIRELKNVKSTAHAGLLRDVRKSLDNSAALADQLSQAVRALGTGWNFDEQAYLARGSYAKELLELAHRSGVNMFEQDDRILCYPVVIRVVPGELAIEVDKHKERGLRPSAVIERLKGLQNRPPRFKPEAFVETLEQAYDLLVRATGKPAHATVRLIDVHDVLTLLPGQSREYTRQEFARDLYLLDQSGVTKTRSGRQLSLPASTLTKGSGVLTTVSKAGQQQVYAGLAFS